MLPQSIKNSPPRLAQAHFSARARDLVDELSLARDKGDSICLIAMPRSNTYFYLQMESNLAFGLERGKKPASQTYPQPS